METTESDCRDATPDRASWGPLALPAGSGADHAGCVGWRIRSQRSRSGRPPHRVASEEVNRVVHADHSAPGSSRPGDDAPHATRTAVASVGLVTAFAGAEHGVGELTQPSTDPGSLFIESWPHVAAFEPLGGEPAMTLIPDLRVAGVVTILTSLALGWWVLRVQARRRDGWLLLGLSVVLLLVGGGFGPPLIGLMLGYAMLRAVPSRPLARPPGTARRALGRRWRLLLVLTVSSFLALFPGLVLLRWWTGIDGSWLPALLPPAAFTGLVLTLLAALAHDRTADTSPAVER